MEREVLGKCPVCNDDLEVIKLKCDSCHTSIEGNFSLCKFCRLTGDQKAFIEVFIKNRGNIKEIEKKLGISYPTVRNKLEEVIVELGYSPKETEAEVDKKEILEKLSNEEISSEEAIKLLKSNE